MARWRVGRVAEKLCRDDNKRGACKVDAGGQLQVPGAAGDEHNRTMRGTTERAGAERAGKTQSGPAGDAGPAGNARTVQQFIGYLRVEKGLQPATCEAYARDVEQFAEHL